MTFQASPYYLPPPNIYHYTPNNNLPYPTPHSQPGFTPSLGPYYSAGYPPPSNGSGWYPQPLSPLSPGAALYQTNRQPSPPSQTAEHTDPSIHPFWRGRLAPLPGFCSPPDTFATQRNRAIEIKKAHTSSNSQVPLRHFAPLPSKDDDTSISSQLDKYAEVFIPQYLKDIQNQPQTFQPLKPIPIFPPSLYHKSFLPSSIIESLVNLFPSTILASPSSGNADTCPPLNVDEYYEHWSHLLSWELDQLAADKQKIILWKVRVSVLDWNSAEFLVLVPGIRENYPRLDIGDIVHLREVLVDWSMGSGIAFEARVTRLRKREGFVHFHCPALKTHIETYIPSAPVYKAEEEVPPAFNISFLANARPSVVMDVAANTLGSVLASPKNVTRDVAHRWLFPDSNDLHNDPPVPSTPPNISGQYWVDNGLNAEQRLAASSIAMYQSPVPFLISGPPGTGKTRTVVETVHQILRTQPEAHILLCAPSNPATDTLAQRLGTSLKPGDMLRLNDQNRTFAEVPDSIRQLCYVENDRFALPPWKSLMKYRVVVTSCLDANILVEAMCTNSALCALEEHTMISLHPHRRMKHQIVPHWTHLLIDEAAQGPEPELLIPISVVLTRADHSPDSEGQENNDRMASYNYHPLSTTPQLVLCGDPNQLGPIITSQEARTHELDVSLLERLFQRPLYAEHSEARQALRRLPLTGLPVNHSAPYTAFKPFANLVKNYRSHPAILMPPSAMFYNDTLEPCATNGLVSWAGLTNNRFPLMFLNCDTRDETLDERATWFNAGEIDRVVEVITSLLSEAAKSIPPLKIEDIGVMSPWREQVWKLREKLRKTDLAKVDVGTVEDYQGREKRVVIISCVRSSPRFLQEDVQKGIGLMYEKKRMNVAVTRAKELLVIVGHGNLLKQDPYWKGFLQFVVRNDLYVGPPLEIELDGAWISRLESRIVEAQEENGFAIPDESGERNTMMLAGGVAREVLRDDF